MGGAGNVHDSMSTFAESFIKKCLSGSGDLFHRQTDRQTPHNLLSGGDKPLRSFHQ